MKKVETQERTTLTCDRCGCRESWVRQDPPTETIDANWYAGWGGIDRYHYIDRLNRPHPRMDLCAECMKSLSEWQRPIRRETFF